MFEFLWCENEERSQRQPWFRKGSQGNLKASSYLPVLDKLMLLLDSFPADAWSETEQGEESIHGRRRKPCLTAELPGAATQHSNKGDPLMLNPWTSGKFWTSFGQVKNLFFIKKTKVLWDKRKGVFFFLFFAYIIDYTPVI